MKATAVSPSMSTEESGLLDEISRHRRFNKAVARCLSGDPLTRDTALAIANCSQRLNLRFKFINGQLGPAQVVNGLLCNRRLCPFCEWRRTRAWRARLLGGLQSFKSEQHKISAIFLTLTMRNCQLYELRDSINHLHSSFKRLSVVRDFPVQAWFRRTEVTVNKGIRCGGPLFGSSVHPHIHALLLVRPSYWSRDYWSQLRWQQEWQMAANLDYAPVIDIRRTRAKTSPGSQPSDPSLASILEAAKYSTKATDLLGLGNLLPSFHAEMKHLRLYGVSRKLQRHIKSQDIITRDLYDQELVTGSTGSFMAVAKWFDAIQEYQFNNE